MSNREYDGFSDSFSEGDATAAARSRDYDRDASGHGPADHDYEGVPADGSSLETRDEAPVRDYDLRGDSQRRSPAEFDEPTEEKSGSKTTGLWVALILGAILLILLLIFVVQNNTPASFEYFTWTFNLPLGVAMLVAAVAGALIMALVGSVRIAQLSWQVRKFRKQQEKLQHTLRG